jgi:hypothetical protein
MQVEQRRRFRRYWDKPGCVTTGDGSLIRGCNVVDLSDSGARIAIAGADQIPDKIYLLLSPDGRVYRQCEIAWRGKDELGLHFINRRPAG